MSKPFFVMGLMVAIDNILFLLSMLFGVGFSSKIGQIVDLFVDSDQDPGFSHSSNFPGKNRKALKTNIFNAFLFQKVDGR